MSIRIFVDGKFAKRVRGRAAILAAGTMCVWATPSYSQAVTWAELQGAVIQSASNFIILSRHNGVDRRGPVRGSWTITVGPGQSITGTLTRENSAGIKTNSATFALGRPQAFADGTTVWFFENGVLTNLRTFQAGGIKVIYAFSRSARGLTCSVRAPFVREDGIATIKRDAIGGTGNAEILDIKTVSSTCRIARR